MGDERISRACPDCGQEIGRSAYCGCGWGKRPTREGVKRFDDVPRVSCGYEPCGISAKLKIQTKTGWLNLCMAHYGQHFRTQAARNCNAKGLTTSAERRQWLKTMCAEIAAKARNRQPGEDEEAA